MVTSIIIVLVICFLCFRTVCFQPEIISHLSKWSEFITPIWTFRVHFSPAFLLALPLFSMCECVCVDASFTLFHCPFQLVIHFALSFFSLLANKSTTPFPRRTPISESVTKWLQNVHVSPMMINTLGTVPVYLVDVCDRIPF